MVSNATGRSESPTSREIGEQGRPCEHKGIKCSAGHGEQGAKILSYPPHVQQHQPEVNSIPLAIRSVEQASGLHPLKKLACLEEIYSGASPSVIATLRRTIKTILDVNKPVLANQQAQQLISSLFKNDAFIGANALIAMNEVARELIKTKRIKPEEACLFISYVASLHTLYQEKVPDKFVSLCEISQMLGFNNILGAENFHPSSSQLGLAGVFILGLLNPVSLGRKGGDLTVYEPVGKKFASNLNLLLTHLPPRRIEVGSGRGMLSAVLNQCVEESQVGKKMLYTSDAENIIKVWPGVTRVLKTSVERIIDKYRSSPVKDQVIYLCTSPTANMLERIKETGEAVLLLVASELYGTKALSMAQHIKAIENVNRLDLAIQPSTVGGGTLLGFNMEPSTFKSITDKIPEPYKMLEKYKS